MISSFYGIWHYANQNHSQEFSNRKMLILCASIFEIICTGPGRDQNNLQHTVKIMVYIHIMFGRLFDNSIKIVNWLHDHNLRELEKLKVSSYLQSDWNISLEHIKIFYIYPLLYGPGYGRWQQNIPSKIIYPADTKRWNNVDSTYRRFNVVPSG